MPVLLDDAHISLWISLWAVVYAGDYYLTILGARLYRSGAHRHFDFGGSYELTPVFQRDIDALRLVSSRFLLLLAISSVLIYLVWFLENRFLPFRGFTTFLMGSLLLREAAVYLRHTRTILLFRFSNRSSDLQGRVSYPRWITMKNSAVELWGFAALYLVLGLLFRSWFVFGGAFSTAVTALQHWQVGAGLERQRGSSDLQYCEGEPEQPDLKRRAHE